MGVLPIGFFSPLPLAIMIPFMATQSLAMGEAFGKSFQYGKRKISSMTNEEFNKYTFNDMMNEQTANVRAYIPKLHEQMELSYTLQIDIFQEMVKIIPAFFEALLKSLQPLATEFQQFNTTPFNQNIPNPNQGGTLVSANTESGPTLISHENLIEEIPIINTKNWTYTELKAKTTAQLELLLSSGQLGGTEISAAQGIIQDRQQATIAETTASQTQPFQETQEDIELQAWQTKKFNHVSAYLTYKARYDGTNNTSSSQDNANHHRRQLTIMSNDYRNPNPKIGKAVILLRREFANNAYPKV